MPVSLAGLFAADRTQLLGVWQHVPARWLAKAWMQPGCRRPRCADCRCRPGCLPLGSVMMIVSGNPKMLRTSQREAPVPLAREVEDTAATQSDDELRVTVIANPFDNAVQTSPANGGMRLEVAACNCLPTTARGGMAAVGFLWRSATHRVGGFPRKKGSQYAQMPLRERHVVVVKPVYKRLGCDGAVDGPGVFQIGARWRDRASRTNRNGYRR
jgi:hypothetical protein